MMGLRTRVTLYDGSVLCLCEGYQAAVDPHSNRLTVLDKLSAKTVITLDETAWKRLEYSPEAKAH
jgi:hypothetical protein